MFIMTHNGRLLNLAHAVFIYLWNAKDGTVQMMADGEPISNPMTPEEGRAGLALILTKQQELAGIKSDKQFERRLQKEQAEIIAHTVNHAYNGIIRYLEWRDRQTWYNRLWWWITKPFYRARSAPERPRKIV